MNRWASARLPLKIVGKAPMSLTSPPAGTTCWFAAPPVPPPPPPPPPPLPGFPPGVQPKALCQMLLTASWGFWVVVVDVEVVAVWTVAAVDIVVANLVNGFDSGFSSLGGAYIGLFWMMFASFSASRIASSFDECSSSDSSTSCASSSNSSASGSRFPR